MTEDQRSVPQSYVLPDPLPEFELAETLKWDKDQGYIFLQQHLDRLRNAAKVFSWIVDLGEIEQALMDAASKFGNENQRVRLQITQSGRIKIENRPLVNLPEPYIVKVSLTPLDSTDGFLYYKTTYRKAHDTAFSTVSDCDDVLFWNEKGELTESYRGNLIIESKEGWFTPPVSCGLLNGVGRQVLLDQGEIAESVIDIDQLLSAKSLWLVNSVRHCWQIILQS